MPNGANVNLRIAHRLAQQVGVLLERLQRDAQWLPAAAPAAAPAASGDGNSLMH
jgi:hypothetical protein